MMVAWNLSMGLQMLQCTGWSSAHMYIMMASGAGDLTVSPARGGRRVRKLRRKCHITSNFHEYSHIYHSS